MLSLHPRTKSNSILQIKVKVNKPRDESSQISIFVLSGPCCHSNSVDVYRRSFRPVSPSAVPHLPGSM